MTYSPSTWHQAGRSLLGALLQVEGCAEASDVASVITRLLLPRLVGDEHPLLVVLGGSTGAGKSTLLNSVLGRQVSRDGVLRPTTRVPVLVHHPDDATLLAARPLPDVVVTVPDDAMLRGLALLDSPDLDSVEAGNRTVAGELIDAADLWVAVTSPARYADAAPWQKLRRAASYGRPVAVVLNRVPALDVSPVSAHLATLLQDEGLGDSPLLVVTEQTVVDGVLPMDAVTPVVGLLDALARDASIRAMVRRSGAVGVTADCVQRVRAMVDRWDAAGEYRADAPAVRTGARLLAESMGGGA